LSFEAEGIIKENGAAKEYNKTDRDFYSIDYSVLTSMY